MLAQVSSNSHHRTARAYAADERFWLFPHAHQLRPDLRAGRFCVRIDVRTIRKLSWQKYVLARRRKFLAHPDAAQETAVYLADRNDFRAIALNQLYSFLTHPLRHEDFH